MGSIPGLGRSPGEGQGYPLDYSGLGNFKDCTVHGVGKSRTQLSDFHFLFHWINGSISKVTQKMGQASITIHLHFILRADLICAGMKKILVL